MRRTSEADRQVAARREAEAVEREAARVTVVIVGEARIDDVIRRTGEVVTITGDVAVFLSQQGSATIVGPVPSWWPRSVPAGR